MAASNKLRIGSWTACPALNQLEREGESVRLEPRVMDVLVYLAERPGEVVSIAELMAAVWKGVVVADGSVYVAIKALRRALAAGDGENAYIETIPKRGYRLTAPVELLTPAEIPVRTGSRRGVLAAAAALLLGLGGVLYLAPWRTVPSSEPAAAAGQQRDYEILRLTNTGNAVMPAISPDGGFVVYAQAETLGWPSSLWVRQVSTGSSTRIVAPEPDVLVAAPTVTPDGRFVDFIRLRMTDEPLTPRLWRVPFLGGVPQRIADGVWSPAGWSPDGSRMAFTRFDSSTTTTALVLADAEGGAEQVVATRTLPRIFLNLGVVGRPPVRPAWSPDGRTVALLEVGTGSGFELRVAFVDAATGTATALDAQGAWSAQSLAWLGPRSLLLNQSSDSGRPVQLWRMSYPDGAIVPVTNDLSNYVGIDLDGARSSLVTSRMDITTGLLIGDAAGETSTEIVRPFPYGGPPAWVAWAGERVLYGGTAADGRPSIAAIAPEGGAPQEIVVDGTVGTGSPDGSTVVFGRDGGLWRLDTARGQVVPLFAGAVNPIIAPDGGRVAFISLQGGMQTPWVATLDGGEPVEVIRAFAGVGSLAFSPDGQQLLFASSTGPVVCDLPACARRRDFRTPPMHPDMPVLRWTPDGEGIAYVDQSGANIWSMPLDGGPPKQITRFDANPPDTMIGSFAWSHDGERLAILRARVTSDVVLLRGLRE